MTKSKPTPLSREYNPGAAKWCDQHQKLECTKMRKLGQGGGPCHAPAIRGTDVCKIHGGRKLEVLRAKGESNITAWRAIGRINSQDRIEPGFAVLGMLQMTWLRAAAYGDLLRRQVEKEGVGDQLERVEDASGLIGYRYGAAGKDGNIYAQSEEIRSLVALEAMERDRVVKYAKTAHDMGISERITSLAEKWGDVVSTRITLILADLNLTPEQERKVPALISTHLSSIDVDGTGK